MRRNFTLDKKKQREGQAGLGERESVYWRKQRERKREDTHIHTRREKEREREYGERARHIYSKIQTKAMIVHTS